MSITKISPDVVDFDAGITISTADNTDTLTLTSTDADANAGPNLRLYRNSGTPADSDALGLIEFEGRNDNTQDVVYAGIDSRIVDASDGTEDGRLEIVTMLAGTAGTSRILMDATETVFNDNSADLDFRVESNDSANMLVVDGGNNKVLIEAQNTDTVSNAATMTAAAVLEINGNAGEGSDHIKIGAMADGTGNQFIEATNSGATAAYKLMINPVNGGNLYSGGNLEFPNGKGIDFAATTNASGAASHLLDDYEEGTWTPAIAAGGWSINSTISATYTKIGRVVHVHTYFSITGTGNSAALIISGLPYNSAANHFAINKIDAEFVNTHGAYVRSDPGTDDVLFLTSEESTSSGRTTLAGNEFGAGYIIFSMTYFV